MEWFLAFLLGAVLARLDLLPGFRSLKEDVAALTKERDRMKERFENEYQESTRWRETAEAWQTKYEMLEMEHKALLHQSGVDGR